MTDVSRLEFIPLPSESEIVSRWSDCRTPYVSVVCATYNHVLYIENAIRGFLLQQTSFPFEIVIHDDASTDGTSEIVLNYVKQYPCLIKYILQKENQFSLGRKVNPLAVEFTKGKYIALCEGDDFWISRNKLQAQINEMKKNPACSISFHSASALKKNGHVSKVARHADNIFIYPTEKLIAEDGSFCPTASLIFKREVFDSLPDWFYKKAPVGDYYLQVFGSISGGALFLPMEMSVYRVLSAGSWTENLFQNKDVGKLISHYEKSIDCLSELDKYTDSRYSESIRRAKSLQALSVSILFFRNRCIKKSIDYFFTSWLHHRSLILLKFVSVFKRWVQSSK